PPTSLGKGRSRGEAKVKLPKTSKVQEDSTYGGSPRGSLIKPESPLKKRQPSQETPWKKNQESQKSPHSTTGEGSHAAGE
ncbi:hypothetical protein NDU88_002693, partial [Pleurodeles waltl]